MKDETVIGHLPYGSFQWQGGDTIPAKCLTVKYRHLMELGERAVEAKDWKHEMCERWEALHCKCPDHVEEWMVNEAVQAYASGLASAEMSDGRVRQNPQTMLAERDALITRLEKEAGERDEKIAELERELQTTRALAGVPIPDVQAESAANTEGLAPTVESIIYCPKCHGPMDLASHVKRSEREIIEDFLHFAAGWQWNIFPFHKGMSIRVWPHELADRELCNLLDAFERRKEKQ